MNWFDVVINGIEIELKLANFQIIVVLNDFFDFWKFIFISPNTFGISNFASDRKSPRVIGSLNLVASYALEYEISE